MLVAEHIPTEELVVFLPTVEEPAMKVPVVEEPTVMDEVHDVEEQVPAMEVVVKEAPTMVYEVSPYDIDAMTRAFIEPTDRFMLTRYDDHVTFRI